jgi:hypothetical protein
VAGPSNPQRHNVAVDFAMLTERSIQRPFINNQASGVVRHRQCSPPRRWSPCSARVDAGDLRRRRRLRIGEPRIRCFGATKRPHQHARHPDAARWVADRRSPSRVSPPRPPVPDQIAGPVSRERNPFLLLSFYLIYAPRLPEPSSGRPTVRSRSSNQPMPKTRLPVPELQRQALLEVRKQPGCHNVQEVAINRVTDGRAETNWSLCILAAGAADANTAARAAVHVQSILRRDYDLLMD